MAIALFYDFPFVRYKCAKLSVTFKETRQENCCDYATEDNGHHGLTIEAGQSGCRTTATHNHFDRPEVGLVWAWLHHHFSASFDQSFESW
jgi:hypothetical protein